MINFERYQFSPELQEELKLLNITFAFQPIFESDGKTIYAYEALMRPKDRPITELIFEYTQRNKLHVLEVATMFGAAQTHLDRGYEEPVSINSFPSESLYEEEVAEFNRHFGNRKGKGIIEILEYPEIDEQQWEWKRSIIKKANLQISVDDYGSGVNHRGTVSFYQPDIVKLDRNLISGIDHNEEKQMRVKRLIHEFHEKNIKALGEGVETKEECEWLINNGIDYLQGYYLAMPE